MVKIPTLFVRDETKPGHPVTDVWRPECVWVRDGEGVPTAKLDGTNLKIEGGQLLKRQKPKNRDYDEASYVPCSRTNPADRWAFEAFDALEPREEGVFELCGPKVQSNPHHFVAHRMLRVVPINHSLQLRQAFGTEVPRTFDGLKQWCEADATFEGIVFHHPDGRMAKIKRRDFGLPWPT